MGCAGALQGGWAQRGFLRTVVVGVDVPDGAVVVVGVAVPDTGVSVPAIAVDLPSVVASTSSVPFDAVPPRSGERSSSVLAGCRFSDETVSEGDRCRPARRSRTSEGRVVEAERKSRTSEMEFDCRTFKGMAMRLDSQCLFHTRWRVYGLTDSFHHQS